MQHHKAESKLPVELLEKIAIHITDEDTLHLLSSINSCWQIVASNTINGLRYRQIDTWEDRRKLDEIHRMKHLARYVKEISLDTEKADVAFLNLPNLEAVYLEVDADFSLVNQFISHNKTFHELSISALKHGLDVNNIPVLSKLEIWEGAHSLLMDEYLALTRKLLEPQLTLHKQQFNTIPFSYEGPLDEKTMEYLTQLDTRSIVSFTCFLYSDQLQSKLLSTFNGFTRLRVFKIGIEIIDPENRVQGTQKLYRSFLNGIFVQCAARLEIFALYKENNAFSVMSPLFTDLPQDCNWPVLTRLELSNMIFCPYDICQFSSKAPNLTTIKFGFCKTTASNNKLDVPIKVIKSFKNVSDLLLYGRKKNTHLDTKFKYSKHILIFIKKQIYMRKIDEYLQTDSHNYESKTIELQREYYCSS